MPFPNNESQIYVLIIIIIIIIIAIIITIIMTIIILTLDHAQPTELCMRGCGYTMAPDFT